MTPVQNQTVHPSNTKRIHFLGGLEFKKKEIFCNSCYIISSKYVPRVVYELDKYPWVHAFYIQYFFAEDILKMRQSEIF
jgi:hypothetical protein